MNGPMPDLPTPLDCAAFRQQLHFRHELRAGARAAFDEHAAACSICTELLLEVEQLDDLLLRWQPDALPARGGREFVERVMAGVQGEGPIASCAETAASLHHWISGDLEPWLATRVERHFEQCAECRDLRDEAQHARSAWLNWRVPDPAENFADRLIERLEPETRAARRRRQLLDWALSPIHVPRAAAALVLTSITLLSLGLLESHRRTTARAGVEADGDGAFAPISHRRAVVPISTATFEPGDRSDPTGSLSAELPIGRAGTFRAAQRGQGDER